MLGPPVMFKVVQAASPDLPGVFPSKWGSPRMQYQVGKTYTLPDGEEPGLCKNGFHACSDVRALCFHKKSFGYDSPNDVLLEVILGGTVVSDGVKSVGQTMTVVREISWAAALLATVGQSPWTDSSLGLSVHFDATEHLVVSCRNGEWEWKTVSGKLHREGDQPAMICTNGSRSWWQNGLLHREGDQPAVISADGTQVWYFDGELHREGDQPAIVSTDGTCEWFINGLYHREGDQPAIVRSNGTKMWLIDGKLHREGDQPAIVRANGACAWWRNGMRHREGDKPAVIHANGTQEWWLNGKAPLLSAISQK